MVLCIMACVTIKGVRQHKQSTKNKSFPFANILLEK